MPRNQIFQVGTEINLTANTWYEMPVTWKRVGGIQILIKVRENNREILLSSPTIWKERLEEYPEQTDSALPSSTDVIHVLDRGEVSIYTVPFEGDTEYGKLALTASANITISAIEVVSAGGADGYMDLARGYMDGVSEGHIPEPTLEEPLIYVVLRYAEDTRSFDEGFDQGFS